MADVQDVANAVVSSFDRSISTMKLQKLVYLSHGWSLALRGKPLVETPFEAWANGPVSRELFRNHRKAYSVSGWPYGDASHLADDEALIVQAVIANYGALTGRELSELTHVNGTPWARARSRARAAEGAPANEPLDDAEMTLHFVDLLFNSPNRVANDYFV